MMMILCVTVTASLLLTQHVSVGLPLLEEELSRPAALQWEGESLAMLDAMSQLMTGEAEFDRDFLSSLSSCMDRISPELRAVSDGAWWGMKEYHATNGAGNDTWGSCLDTGHCHKYHEQNLTVQEYHNISIYEPCNYASNVAYYHVVTSICDYSDWSLSSPYQLAMAQSFTALTVGSAFWHGSHTLLGNIADNRFIDVVGRPGTCGDVGTNIKGCYLSPGQLHCSPGQSGESGRVQSGAGPE